MRSKNHMAVWQHYPLLEEVAFTWGNLLAEAIRDIGDVFLEKSGAVESETTH
jgi:hypothetical protein